MFIYNENSKRFPVGTIESTYSSIDALKFDVFPQFSDTIKCLDWSSVINYENKKAIYNPYVYNNISWNTLRIHGGYDNHQQYVSEYVEFIPAPINPKLYFQQALPGGLSDRFKMVSGYNADTKLAHFVNCEDENLDSSRQWQRMIYWMLFARCGRDDIWPPPPLPYNPDETCNENILNILANINATNSGDPVWKKMPTNNFTLTKKEFINKWPNLINMFTAVSNSTISLNKTDITSATNQTLQNYGFTVQINNLPSNIDYSAATHYLISTSWTNISNWTSNPKSISALAWSITTKSIVNGAITNSSTVTLLHANSDIKVGYSVTGTGISSGTTVVSIVDKTLILNQNNNISNGAILTFIQNPASSFILERNSIPAELLNTDYDDIEIRIYDTQSALTSDTSRTTGTVLSNVPQNIHDKYIAIKN